jgi:fatty acid desaturase
MYLLVWINSSTHISNKNIEYDRELSWFRSQLETTVNYSPNYFVTWFTGHINFQIEHQLVFEFSNFCSLTLNIKEYNFITHSLFPTMPRHNLHRLTPYVKEICKKYDIKYNSKSLFQAMLDFFW